MATTQDSMDFIMAQLPQDESMRYKKMFGEYGVFLGNKMFALVCDNQLFIKPTEAGRALLGANVVEAPPYPGAKNAFLIEQPAQNKQLLAELTYKTAEALPAPKPRRKKPKP